MDALLMCGGEGTRLESDDDTEKPLVPIAGEPMVDRVRRALEASAIETVCAVVSPNAPATRAHLAGARVARIETPGDGYVADLLTALESDRVEPPVLTVAADLPLLEGPAIDRVLEAYRKRTETKRPTRADAPSPSCTVCVPTALKRRLGASCETTLESDAYLAPTGVNIVGDGDGERRMTHPSYDYRVAINVNRPTDVRLADDLCDRNRGVDE